MFSSASLATRMQTPSLASLYDHTARQTKLTEENHPNQGDDHQETINQLITKLMNALADQYNTTRSYYKILLTQCQELQNAMLCQKIQRHKKNENMNIVDCLKKQLVEKNKRTKILEALLAQYHLTWLLPVLANTTYTLSSIRISTIQPDHTATLPSTHGKRKISMPSEESLPNQIISIPIDQRIHQIKNAYEILSIQHQKLQEATRDQEPEIITYMRAEWDSANQNNRTTITQYKQKLQNCKQMIKQLEVEIKKRKRKAQEWAQQFEKNKKSAEHLQEQLAGVWQILNIFTSLGQYYLQRQLLAAPAEKLQLKTIIQTMKAFLGHINKTVSDSKILLIQHQKLQKTIRSQEIEGARINIETDIANKIDEEIINRYTRAIKNDEDMIKQLEAEIKKREEKIQEWVQEVEKNKNTVEYLQKQLAEIKQTIHKLETHECSGNKRLRQTDSVFCHGFFPAFTHASNEQEKTLSFASANKK